MREILHFNSEKEKIAYLKGEFHEVLPKEVDKTHVEVVEETPVVETHAEEVPEAKEEKPKAKKKAKKSSKKDKEEKDDEVQAE